MAENLIEIEVAYALPTQQLIIPLKVKVGSYLEQGIKESGILSQFPEIDFQTFQVGVFGKVCRLDDVLKTGDRIEIYRPLICDPKQARRARSQNN